MFSSKSVFTILVVAALLGLLAVCASADMLVSVWSTATNQQILRYGDAGGNPTVFADLPNTTSWDQGMQKMAYNQADGYLYVTNYGDSNGSTALWGDGSQFVTRYNGVTGAKDADWKVWVRSNNPVNRAGEIEFSPDGKLYVSEHLFGSINLIDIAAKTSTQVKTGIAHNSVAFDTLGRGYISSANKVERFTISGATWTLDSSFNTGAATPGGTAYGMVFNPNDGYLYVNDYSVNVHRFNSTGARDLNWAANTGGFSREMEIGADGKLYVANHFTAGSFDLTTGTNPTYVRMSYDAPPWNMLGAQVFDITYVPVPEPGSLLALCAGLGSMAALLRRRK